MLRIIFSTALMEAAPNRLMGRVTSTSMLISFVVQILSFAAIGFIVDDVSVFAGYSFLAFFAVIIFAGLIVRAGRRAKST
jgi:hypothetical protein